MTLITGVNKISQLTRFKAAAFYTINTLLPRFLPYLYHSLYTKVTSHLILVKLENKQDRRTIEETMAERRAKKLGSSSTTIQSTDIVTEQSPSENTAQSTPCDSSQTTT